MELEKEVTGEEAESPTAEQTVEELLSEEEVDTEVVPEEEEPEPTPEGDEPEGEPEEDPETEPEGEEEPPKQEHSIPKKRLDREIRKRREAEAELEKLRSTPAPEPDKQEPKKLSIDQFETEQEYIDAVAEQKVEEKLSAKLAEQKAVQESNARQASEAKIRDNFNKSMDDAEDKYEDFNESYDVVDSISKSSPAMTRAIVVSEYAGDLINHLAKNQDEAERIAKLPPEAQFKAIGVIESKLSSPPKPKNKTRAPQPVKAGSGSSPTGNIKWKEGMSDDERKEFADKAEKSGLSVMDAYGLDK